MVKCDIYCFSLACRLNRSNPKSLQQPYPASNPATLCLAECDITTRHDADKKKAFTKEPKSKDWLQGIQLDINNNKLYIELHNFPSTPPLKISNS